MTAVFDFFFFVFWFFLLCFAPNMKLTVLEDYLELTKTLEIWNKLRNKVLFFGVQNLKFHVSNPKIHVRFVKIQLSSKSPESIQNLDTKDRNWLISQVRDVVFIGRVFGVLCFQNPHQHFQNPRKNCRKLYY